MLGVLVIVGVLSVAALFGFTYAMNKYKANETIHDVMLRASNVPMIDEYYQIRPTNYAFKFPDLQDELSSMGYTMKTLKTDEFGYVYKVEAPSVPRRICSLILQMEPTDIDEIRIGTEKILYTAGHSELCEEYKDSSTESTMMTFYFERGCETNADCSKCQECYQGRCKANYDLPGCGEPVECNGDDDCPDGLCCRDGSCTTNCGIETCDPPCDECHTCDESLRQCIKNTCSIESCPEGQEASGYDKCGCIEGCIEKCPDLKCNEECTVPNYDTCSCEADSDPCCGFEGAALTCCLGGLSCTEPCQEANYESCTCEPKVCTLECKEGEEATGYDSCGCPTGCSRPCTDDWECNGFCSVCEGGYCVDKTEQQDISECCDGSSYTSCCPLNGNNCGCTPNTCALVVSEIPVGQEACYENVPEGGEICGEVCSGGYKKKACPSGDHCPEGEREIGRDECGCPYCEPCPDGEFSCGTECCNAASETCCGGSICCPVGHACCEGVCCGEGQTCGNNGVCCSPCELTCLGQGLELDACGCPTICGCDDEKQCRANEITEDDNIDCCEFVGGVYHDNHCCSTDLPYWSDEEKKCVKCLIDQHCQERKDGKIRCNQETKICECPEDKPYFSGEKCVECLNNANCSDRTDGKTQCDTETYTCISGCISLGETCEKDNGEGGLCVKESNSSSTLVCCSVDKMVVKLNGIGCPASPPNQYKECCEDGKVYRPKSVGTGCCRSPNVWMSSVSSLSFSSKHCDIPLPDEYLMRSCCCPGLNYICSETGDCVKIDEVDDIGECTEICTRTDKLYKVCCKGGTPTQTAGGWYSCPGCECTEALLPETCSFGG